MMKIQKLKSNFNFNKRFVTDTDSQLTRVDAKFESEETEVLDEVQLRMSAKRGVGAK